MHIVFLDSSAALGGAERVLLDLLAGLRRTRPDWTLTLCAPGEGPVVDRARGLGVAAVLLPFPDRLSRTGDYGLKLGAAASALPGALNYGLKLRTVLRSLNPNVIHSNSLKMHLASAWAKPPDASLVWHLHDYVSRRARSAALLRRSAHAVSAIVANSQSVADDAERALRPKVVPQAIVNGVNLEVFSPTGPVADLDDLAGVPAAPAGTVRVGLVATYAKWKGHDTFLQAVARVPSRVPLRAYVVGGPIYQTAGSQVTRAQLEAEARRLNIRDRVVFVDFVEEPASIFRALDVVVHASTEPEPFGLVVAEAMACGRAVVAANAGGVPEIVSIGRDGLLYEPGDVTGLADTLSKLAVEAELRQWLGHAAGRTATRVLGVDRLVHEFRDLYERVGPTTASGMTEPVHA